MKKILLPALMLTFVLFSCTKKEEEKNTNQADYKETYEKEIDNPTKDANYRDTAAAKGGQTGFVKDSTLQKNQNNQ